MNQYRRAGVRTGFTLVEVMLTTVLASVLLLALWSLLSMYSKTFEGGQARTEQSQLSRALFEQISTDLESVLVPPPVVAPPPPNSPPPSNSSPGGAPPLAAGSPPPAISTASAAAPVGPSLPHYVSPPSPATGQSSAGVGTPHLGESVASTASLRPAGVFGTSTFLQIDVLQPAMLIPASDPDELAFTDLDAQPRADELKTVTYSFEEDRDPANPTAEVQTRLVRREQDWARAHPAHGAETDNIALGASADEVSADEQWPAESPVPPLGSDTAAPPFASEPTLDGLAPEEESSSLLETSVPEVLDFSLRYFDGALWSEEWDSISRQGLPVAIEVSLRLRSFEEPAAPAVEVAADKPGVDREKLELWKHPTRRLLIPLTLSRKTRGASEFADSLPGELPGAPPAEHTIPLGAQSNAGFVPQ